MTLQKRDETFKAMMESTTLSTNNFLQKLKAAKKEFLHREFSTLDPAAGKATTEDGKFSVDFKTLGRIKGKDNFVFG